MPTDENEPAESRLNLTDLNLIELNQDPDQCSEEPKANFAKEGKHRCITHYFQRYYSSNYSYIVRIDGPRGGVNWAFFKFLKQIKATLTYAMLVRLNSPTG